MKQQRLRVMAPWLLTAAVLLGLGAGAPYILPPSSITYASTRATVDSPPTPVATATDPSAAREEGLTKLKGELEEREGVLKAKEAQVNGLLKDLRAEQSETDAVRKVASLYSAMPPYKAAPLMQSLDTEMTVRILRLLDEDQAAAVLAYMDSQRGALLVKELMKPPTSKSSTKE